MGQKSILKIKFKIQYFELNINEVRTCQNLWDAVKLVLRVKYLALIRKKKACIRKKKDLKSGIETSTLGH